MNKLNIMEKEKIYRWSKIKDGLPYIAIVDIEVYSNLENANKVIENYSGSGFKSQGSVEEATHNGYDSWKIASRQGLNYAFTLTQNYWTVKINSIQGRAFTDTNPIIVGYTVIRAFCEKINLQINENEVRRLENFVYNSWNEPHKELIPNFHDLTSFEYIENKNKK